MPQIKITAELNRPDGGVVPPNSIADSDPRMIASTKQVVFPISLHFNQQAKDDKKPLVPAVDEFKNRLVKDCNTGEWTALEKNANAGALLAKFMKEVIEDKIGVGNATIIT